MLRWCIYNHDLRHLSSQNLKIKARYMDNSLKITALQPEVLVKLLKQAGSRTASPEMIAEDLASGAPQNPDGTINLIEYAAWLAKEEDDEL